MHGFLLCPRLLDGAVPIWRATRGAFCTYSVQCVHGSTFDTVWTPPGPRDHVLFNRCGVNVGTRENSKQGSKISHTRTESTCPGETPPQTRESGLRRVSRVRARVEKKRTHTAQKPYTVTKTMYNGEYNALNASCKCQFKWQVPKTRTPGDPSAGTPRTARAHRHTHTPRDTRHTEIAQITVTERARLRSSVGKLGGPPTPFAPHRPFG